MRGHSIIPNESPIDGHVRPYKSYQILWLFDSAKMNLMDNVDDFITGIQEYLARKAYTS